MGSTFTAVDAASGIMLGLEKNILLGMGKAAQKVRKDFEDMVRHTQNALKGLATTKYIFDEMIKGIKVSATLQEAMGDLERTLKRSGENAGAFREEMDKIRDVAGSIELLFPFGQKEVIEAATRLAQGGMSRKDIAEERGALYSVGALASIGKIYSEESASLVLAGANIFDVKGAEIGKMADWFQRIGTTTPLRHSQQAQALHEGGPSARTLGISYKDTLTAMGTYAKQTGDAATAGERFEEFGQRIMGATKQEKKALKKAGLSFYDKKGRALPFESIVKELQEFREKAQKRGLTDEEIAQLFKEIFQGRGEFMAFALSHKGEGSFQDVRAKAEESLSIEEKTASVLEEVSTKWRALTGNIQTFLADAFDPLLKDVGIGIDYVNDLVGKMDSFVKVHKELTEWSGKAVAAIGALVGLRTIVWAAQALLNLTRVRPALGLPRRVLKLLPRPLRAARR